MIHTLTLNPALDRTLILADPLCPGSMHRISILEVYPGGKGINVSRNLRAAGKEGWAFFPADTNSQLLQLLGNLKVLTVRGKVRTNLTIVDGKGETTTLNETGYVLSQARAMELIEKMILKLVEPGWVVMAGSLPPGLGEDFYALAIGRIRRARPNIQIALDASQNHLSATLKARPSLDLIKPNDLELAELLEVDPLEFRTDPKKAILVAKQILDLGVKRVLLTLGAQGAALITASGSWWAKSPRISVQATVGAGDSALAGFLLGLEEGLGEIRALVRAVQYGCASASMPGTSAPTPEQAKAFRVEEPKPV